MTLDPRRSWSWYPRKREDAGLALIGVEGYGDSHGGSRSPAVVFSIIENVPPYQVLRNLRPVSVRRAIPMRERLIAQCRAGIVIKSHYNVTNDDGAGNKKIRMVP